MRNQSTKFYPVESASNEYKQLQDYLINSHGHTHYLQLKVSVVILDIEGHELNCRSGPGHIPHRT